MLFPRLDHWDLCVTPTRINADGSGSGSDDEPLIS
jgi:hypothetical protein